MDNFDPSHVDVDYLARSAADAAERKATAAAGNLAALELKVKKLLLLNEALFELLANKLSLTADELPAMIKQVEVNRKNRSEMKATCVSCGMSGPAAKPKCVYCGGELLGAASSLFDI